MIKPWPIILVVGFVGVHVLIFSGVLAGILAAFGVVDIPAFLHVHDCK